MLAQLGLHGCDINGVDGLDARVAAEEPEREVHVVDVAVGEDAAGELGVGDEEAGWVELVAGLGAKDAGAADCAVFYAVKASRSCGKISELWERWVEVVLTGSVEAARKAAEDFKKGLFGCCVDYF